MGFLDYPKMANDPVTVMSVRPLSSEKDVVYVTLRHLTLHRPTETNLPRKWEREWDGQWRWGFRDDEFR